MGHHYLCAPILLLLLNRLLLGYLMTRCENQECTNELCIMQDILNQGVLFKLLGGLST